MKPIINYIVVALVICGAILVGFYHDSIGFLADIPSGVVLAILFVIAIASVEYFWYREYQNEKLKDEFVTVITHKFRTPMTAIKWSIEMLHSDVTFQVRDDLLKEMERASERITEIVDLVTGFARYNSRNNYTYKFTSLRKIVDGSLQRYAEWTREKKISFHIDAPENMPEVYVDASKMQFVTDILLENAIKYSPEGGLINMLIARDGDNLVFAVQDGGIGLSLAEQAMLFKRFWRSPRAKEVDTEGMGLGLNTARNVVGHHGGKMWAKSDGENKGATFYFSLPIKEKAVEVPAH